MKFIIALVLALACLPVSAVECIRPSTPVTPVLVLERVDTSIQGIDNDQLQTVLKQRLLEGGKYRVALPDQYRLALANNKIDRCTPTIAVSIAFQVASSDPGAAYGIRGLVTRHKFTAKTVVRLLPEGVTVDSVVLEEQADSVLTSKKAQEAFARLLQRLAETIEEKRDTWTQSDTPGF